MASEDAQDTVKHDIFETHKDLVALRKGVRDALELGKAMTNGNATGPEVIFSALLTGIYGELAFIADKLEKANEVRGDANNE
jgi:hypothetical protein